MISDVSVFTIIIYTSLSLTSVRGQSYELDSTNVENADEQKTNNVIGFVPSKASVTNGWAIGWTAAFDDYPSETNSIRINGLHTNFLFVQAYVAVAAITMCPFQPKELFYIFRTDTETYDDLVIKHKMNGVSVSFLELGEAFSVQGLQITGLFHFVDKLNGVSITSLGSHYTHFNGVMISGIYNNTNRGRGTQIGLVNKATKLNGVQVGLWNKIGNRGFPLINMSFKRG
jgi:hypothetical protein